MKKQHLLRLFILVLTFISSTLLYGQAPLKTGQAVVSTYSGRITANSHNVLYVFDVRNTNAVTPGVLWNNAPIYTHPSWSKENLGQIFGVTLDESGNIYVTATSTYGLFPPGPAGSGGVYKINGATFAITNLVTTNLSANANTVGTAQIPNSLLWGYGTGLGDIAYNRIHKHLYVTNFEDGMIYRINPSNGIVLSRFDPKFFATTNVTNTTSSFVLLEQRPWAIAVFGSDAKNQRVYYSLWAQDKQSRYGEIVGGNSIWSVALDANGEFIPGSEQVEVASIPFNATRPNGTQYSMPVADIAFSSSGKMLLAERGMNGDLGYVQSGNPGNYAHEARVLEYTGTPGAWVAQPVGKFLIGSYNPNTMAGGKNSCGGVDFGYGYVGSNSTPSYCDSMVWTTGNSLHPYGSAPSTYYYGVQGLKPSGGTVNNSIITDLNGILNQFDKQELGDLEIMKDNLCPNNPGGTAACTEIGTPTRLDTNCCQVTLPFTASAGLAPVFSISVSIDGGLTNGYLESFNAISSCGAPLAWPVYGQASSILMYVQGCSSITDLNVEVAPNNASGIVNLTWAVQHKNGFVCTYKSTVHCRRKPVTACDVITLKNSHFNEATNLAGKRFKVTNMKAPQSPICEIKVNVTDFSGNLVQNTIGQVAFDNDVPSNTLTDFTPGLLATPFRRLPGNPSYTLNSFFNTQYSHSVFFNVNVIPLNFLNQHLNISLTVYHCDGDSCTYTYGPWNMGDGTLPPKGLGTGLVQIKPHYKELFAASFGIKGNDSTLRRPVKWIAIQSEDTASKIYAMSGATSNQVLKENKDITILSSKQSNKMALFELEDGVFFNDTTISGDFRVIFTGKRPRVKYYLLDEEGEKIIADTFTIEPGNVASVKKMEEVSPQIEILVFPNPATGYTNLSYSLNTPGFVSVQVTHLSGKVIYNMEKEMRFPGAQSEFINLSGLTPGVYLINFQSHEGNASLPLVKE